ncbi:MarR family winged helix-turn-helix transcriptional regulator [Streptomyces aureocirculatus]|uniref:MarR family winged helix-turn-helix transcriptional regulator n=1 Tax=Streptomyces aureocirculatus TaxID=67275 RepID=UPI00099E1206|nr:MarR family winged helix-turn-helix transcriptional regulator [Streptomyces aureocirculatus]
MVDDMKVNQVVEKGKGDVEGRARRQERQDTPGYELPLLLFAGFRTLIDRLHAELARQGHPDMRPAHGFAMQAVGAAGASASEVGRRLGVTKQAAGKTVDRLVALGYAERADDPADARRKLVRLTPRGLDALTRSAAIFDALRAEWARELGPDRVRALESDLRAVVPAEFFRLDAAGWLGGA